MGVSLHLIEDEGIDSGAILAQSLWSVSEDTTAWDLYLQSLDKGDELLRRVAEQIVHRRITPQPQDGRFSSYHPPNQIDFRQTQINWAVPAKALSVWIRARVFPPLQLPWFSWQGEEVKVIRCRAAGACRGQAGAVMTTSPLVIATARGGVEVMEVQWKDEVMSGSMWADRAQLAVGTVFSFRGQ